MTERVFSIVVPVYYNALNIPDTIPQLLALEKRTPGMRIELVLVDDGSGDASLKLLREHQESDPARIKVVKLTRNFGSMAAIQAGFTLTTGDCVGMIAADLQDPPEMFLEMLEHWQRGTKAVFAVRADREESMLQKAFAGAFYGLLRRFAIRHYPRGGFDFFLVDRAVVDQLNRIGEKNTNVMTLIFWMGFPYITIPYVRRRRQKGRSRWTMAKKVKLFVDSLVGFSYLPIRMLSICGILVAGLSFLYAAFVVWSRVAHGTPVQGWASLAVLTAFAAGLQMVMLGILGEYLWRTLDEVRRRPAFVIDEIYPATRAASERLPDPTPRPIRSSHLPQDSSALG